MLNEIHTLQAGGKVYSNYNVAKITRNKNTINKNGRIEQCKQQCKLLDEPPSCRATLHPGEMYATRQGNRETIRNYVQLQYKTTSEITKFKMKKKKQYRKK